MNMRGVVYALVAAGLTPVAALGQWSDNFDAYSPGSINGQGGWKGWDGVPSAAGIVTSAISRSAPNSQQINSSSDSVRLYSGVSSGVWTYTAHQFIPSTFTGQTYFILLNTYNDGGPYDWSVQLNFDTASGFVIDDLRSGVAVPFVRDAWAQIRIDIDLSANTVSQYYNGALIASGTWTTGTPSVLNLAAVDLYGGTGSNVFYDDMSLNPLGAGATWNEGPTDAGDTLATAQVVDSPDSGALARIMGTLGTGDVDLYKIHICDPANFSASTVGGTSVDTQLFLFKLSGVGIAKNDDSGGAQSTLSAAFTGSLPAGDYYLAISSHGKNPLDIGNSALWSSTPVTGERAPDGPGAANGAWSWAGAGSAGGAYTITLGGVSLSPCMVTSTPMFGLAHVAAGSALLSARADGTLLVSNIGSSGNDGVDIMLGWAEGWGFTIDTLDVINLPVGAYKEWTMRGTIDGALNQRAWTERHAVAESSGMRVQRVSLDTSPMGTTLNEVEVFNEGSLLYERSVPNGDVYDLVTMGPVAPGGQLVAQWDATCVVLPRPDPWPIKPKESAIAFPAWSEVETYALNPTRLLTDRTMGQSRAAGVSSEVLRDELLTVLGVHHRSLGVAMLGAGPTSLVVSNIGSSGQDGVSVLVGAASAFDVALTINGAGTAPNNSFLTARALGILAGIPDQPLGDITFRKTGAAGPGAVAITVDFSAIGSPTHHVVILSAGAVVADISGHTGPVGTASTWPISIGKLGGPTECYRKRWPTGTQFVVSGTTFIGDEMRVLAESSSGVLGSKSALKLRAAGLGGVTLTEVSVTPPCPIDYTGDGIIDFSDYLEFLNLFDAQDPRADLNGDGLVDFADYLEFLNFYDAGC